jgi:bifunctional non-homologous end joining protein LigD
MASRTASKSRPVSLRKPLAGDPLPDFVAPELATLVDLAPSGADWLHELKFDGYRLIARIRDGRATLMTRRGLDWTPSFRSIADSLEKLPVQNAMLDGEAVVLGDNGISSFGALQEALSAGRHDSIVIFLFDLLHLDGSDLRPLPLEQRRAALQKLLRRKSRLTHVRFSDAIDEPGPKVLQQACRMGLEGIVSKLRQAPYRSGRARDWLKAKCTKGREFVIGGYTRSDKAGRAHERRRAAPPVFQGPSLRQAGARGHARPAGEAALIPAHTAAEPTDHRGAARAWPHASQTGRQSLRP